MVCASDAQRLTLPPIRCDNRRALRVFSGIQPTGAVVVLAQGVEP